MNVARRQELQTALLGTFNLRNGVDLTAKAALAQEKRSIAVNEERCEGGKAEKRRGGKRKLALGLRFALSLVSFVHRENCTSAFQLLFL